MTSKKTWPDEYHPTLKALQLQTEKKLSELAPLERDLSARFSQGADDDQKEYRTKGAIRCLELTGAADEDEV